MTYQEEKDLLCKKTWEKINILRDIIAEDIKNTPNLGLDSVYVTEEKAVIKEYNNKLLALKQKYGIG